MPSGEFPTPVHLSLRSWTSCFWQLLRGPARPAPSSSQGKRAACPSASPHLNLYLSIAPEQTGVGTLYPERDGATSSTGRWSIFVGVSSLLCAVSVWSWVWQQLAFLWKQREEKEKFHSHHKILFSWFFCPCLTVSVWGAPVFQQNRDLKDNKNTEKTEPQKMNVRKQYRTQLKKQIVFYTYKFPLRLTASQEYFQGIGRKKLN